MLTNEEADILNEALNYAEAATLEEDQLPDWVERGRKILEARTGTTSIVVEVSGGVVQAVIGVPENVEVHICDYDNGHDVDPDNPPDDVEQDLSGAWFLRDIHRHVTP